MKLNYQKIFITIAVNCLLPLFFIAVAGAGNNKILGALPGIYNTYETAMNDLYKEYKKAGTKAEKEAVKQKRKPLMEEYASKVTASAVSGGLVGNEIPFKVTGKLPFAVQKVIIASVTPDAVKFNIVVEMSQNLKDKNGEIKQREKIYFCAADPKGVAILKTWNWATSHDWVKLTKGTIYQARGHWNANRVMNMHNFEYIKIVPKEDYKK